jgi:hypothetical protein
MNLDFVFLSYKEINAKINFQRAQSFIPTLKWVKDIYGFDAAHKACAASCDSSVTHVCIIDGDNYLVNQFNDRFNRHIHLVDHNSVAAFLSQNSVNGLTYGNGSIKIWPIDLLRSRNSHASNIDYSNVYQPQRVGTVLSFSVIDSSAQQAFTAGFREGVKLALDESLSPVKLSELPHKNKRYFNLNVWTSIGADNIHGHWAIYGAQLGFLKVHFDKEFDIKFINNLDDIYKLFDTFETAERLAEHIVSNYDIIYVQEKTKLLFKPLDNYTSLIVKNNFINKVF